MLIKIKRFLAKPFKIKVKIFLILAKLSVRKLAFYLVAPLIKLLITTRMGREFLFDAMPKNELLVAKTNENLYYLINSSDKVIGKSVYVDKKSFDAHHLTTAVALIPSHKSILLDVGANIGTIGIFGVSQGYFEKCIAFEPEPNNFKLLKLNVFLNGLEEKFDLRNEALSNEQKGTLNFELSEDNYGDHRVHIQKTPGIYKEADRKIISVAVNTLDSVLVDNDIDECVLFMDTQGFEGHVLGGAKKLIQNGVPMLTEFWPYGLNRSNGLSIFYDVLSKAQYTAMWDLKNPSRKIDFSIDELKKIASDLGTDGDQTDLLFVNERNETK
jgi:FkbM family methyltransferase